ncbi:bifunctional methylenetetrahydrofolate dehydrogenase/methenyltetrahydrofolate cyclohydrolase FolD [Ligilactobacillus sp. WILCCON 0076]|uniref:Bifunctional protein FolD n=1 Tax=Ligilactobacillus ubinensis TaxID=2876789 RepID=A0A9X2JLB7_9LACO|nr:bifunctional methylenetetrahydrofolate dehydrogenase/methenyltetrahydrofolate cyclohydrolase FolD [Ligilactobacillus ubinensis]MCP0886425.1 bifunctional methylenetetrahydrofolate dehydrogenase/methenyltetrahydrofolate cyclohydrolase FolD [Ligilactobacillus ubinensis]
MTVLMDGRKLSKKIKEQLRVRVEKLEKSAGIVPRLVVIMVGQDAASQIYVRNKQQAAKKIGIQTIDNMLPEDTKEEEILNLIYEYNEDPNIHGILVQLPLPAHINEENVTHAILPAKDVDGFHPVNMGHLFMNAPHSLPCTPRGIMELFKEYEISPKSKNVVIIGRSNIVGRPMAALMINADATVTIAHSKTLNLSKLTQQADIVIVATGQPQMLTGEDIKKDAVVIDVGMNRLPNGKLVGDVDQASIDGIASYLTPVPGGVGPMTIAMLMKQVVEFAERSVKNDC